MSHTQLLRTFEFNQLQQLSLADDLVTWLVDGLSPYRALQVMRVAAAEQSDKRYLKVLDDILSGLQQGHSLALSMQRWFHPDILLIFQNGQSPLDIEQLLRDYAGHQVMRRNLLTTGFKQLMYPLTLLIVSVIGVWLTGQVMLPRFAALLPNDAWPAASRWLSLVSAVLIPALMTLVCAFIVLSGVVFHRAGHASRYELRYLDRFGFFAIYRLYTGVTVLMHLHMLLRQRMNLTRAATLLAEQARGLAKNHYKRMLEQLDFGETSMPRILDTGLLDSASILRLQMSQGEGYARGKSLGELASLLAKRATNMIRHRLRGLMILCYGVTGFSVVLITAGLGQMVMTLVEQWQ
ncbi:MAG: type II secretion system F family protein [Idiomarina sp.]|nr:type II secretion system F family protein [Idiomarina sp.]